MSQERKENNLAIVKYYDTDTIVGLRLQLLNSMDESSRILADVSLRFVEPLAEFCNRIIQKKKDEYLLNGGSLDYLDKQEAIQTDLKELAKNLYPPSCVNENRLLLETCQQRWGEAIKIRLEMDYTAKPHARKKFNLAPADTIQYQKLICSDLLENFTFIEKVLIPENQNIPGRFQTPSATMLSLSAQ